VLGRAADKASWATVRWIGPTQSGCTEEQSWAGGVSWAEGKNKSEEKELLSKFKRDQNN
jgi:hypothetical protein